MIQKYQKTLILTLCFFYFSPLLIVSKTLRLSSSFFIFLMLWCSLGFIVLIYLWKLFEKRSKEYLLEAFKKESGYEEKKVYEQQIALLNEKIEKMSHELSSKVDLEEEFFNKLEQLKEIHRKQEEEYNCLNQDLQTQLQKRENILYESKLTIKEQRQVIGKKQEEINTLNNHIHDLKSEIDKLLKLEEQPVDLFSKHTRSIQNFSINIEDKDLKGESSLTEKLQKYIDLAQKMTETNPYNKQKNGRNFPFGTLIIDQRRLFDRLQNEDAEVILVYSSEERRLIFINNQVKFLLGWAPDKFIKDFQFIVQKGSSQWEQALKDLHDDELREVQMLLKTRSGENILTHCYLKKIPQGAFEGHILGILTSAAKR